MPTENSNTTNLNVVTGAKLEEFGTQIWDAMKVYLSSNIDNSALMGTVKAYLDSANREVIGTTGTAKAQAIDASIAAMVAAFQDAGVTMTGKTAADFAEIIGQITQVSGVYLLDENNVQWTHEHWAEEKRSGAVMPNLVGILLVMANQEIIMSLDETSLAWGTYNVNLSNLDNYAGGPAGTPKDGEYNTYMILAECNPDKLIARGLAVVYEPDTTTMAQLNAAYCVMFADSAAQVAFAQAMGLAQMNTWGQRGKVYAYGTTGNWRTSYWKAGQSTINANSFQQIYAKTPIADTYGFIGSPSAEWCYEHKAYTGDLHNWYEGSVVELFAIYLNRELINTCLAADSRTLVSAGVNYWSSLQSNNFYAYYVELGSGSINNVSKNNLYRVRAFTKR